MNRLYLGDCLDVLKELHHEHPEGFVDLVYIDPPFNSKRNYNILFEDADLTDDKAQKEAFADTWSNINYKDTLEVLKDLDLDLASFLETLDHIRFSKSSMAYITTMAIRILYINKVLKQDGSFYLHCDSTMSHYLKIICDLIFGENAYRNEIIWKRADTVKGNFGQGRTSFDPNADTVFLYTKSNKNTFHQPFNPYSQDYLDNFYKYVEPDTDRRYRLISMIGTGGAAKGNPQYEVMGVTRYWRYSKKKMKELIDAGMVVQTKAGNVPQRKQYLDEGKGVPVQTIWHDISGLSAASKERLGYPTQKPVALLKRIIEASSNEGDLVADFFCGCGTTVSAAQELKRNWIGVDISHLAIGLIARRLTDAHGVKIRKTFEIFGFPKDAASAKMLAEKTRGGRMKFQDWIIEGMLHGVCNPKKTADGGWDGHITFDVSKKKEVCLIEVKSGKVNVKNVREFIHVVEADKRSMGAFVCFEQQVTKPMREAAKDAGYYGKEYFGTQYDKIQIITVEDLLEGRRINMPLTVKGSTFKKAQRKLDSGGKQKTLKL